MRRETMIAVTVLAAFCALPVFGQRAALFDELTPLYPDSDPKDGVERFELDTPRGVPAGMHVLVADLPGEAAVRWALTLDGQAVVNARAYRLIDVPVEQNTGLVSRTEGWDGKDNRHVIREAPFRVYEALEPVRGELRGSDTGVLAFRLEVPVAPDAEAGSRAYVLTLTSGDWHQALQWKLEVHPVAVPPSGSQSPGYTNWFSPDIIAQRHDLARWSEPFWQMLGRYADVMARGRQNTFWVRWRDFVTVGKGRQITLDRPRFKRYVQTFLKRGFTRVEGGHLANRHKGDWSSPRLDLNFTGSDVTSDAGRAELALLLSEVRNALDELDLSERIQYLQHLSDEPTDTNAESYKALAEQVRGHLPGVKIFEATMSTSLVGAVDHWCPQVQEYQKRRGFFEARKKAGDAVWVYTCLAPGGPWLNRLLDQERLRPVYVGWALTRYELAGFLHWGFNHYRAGVDPFEQSVVPHGKGPPNYLPAGDSHVVYPGKNGPLSGVRFEAHRIGMEDAELLRLLKARDPARARTIIARVFRAFDDYETDVAAYRATRSELLAALAAEQAP